ncbi:lasso RiPP family leader peptide-containing protein [Streptomyces sp. UNOC14_S4]|nr:lasso RiPP family leader peptide-containing protein [Streptomyces sp. UNOC14_S4]MCC3770364.1 lasso RiPP family leader peptide-containing protein [Streptomyces sp. UNOC14_S4]
MEQQEIYEPPELVEVGEFGELTRGASTSNELDGGPPPFQWFPL